MQNYVIHAPCAQLVTSVEKHYYLYFKKQIHIAKRCDMADKNNLFAKKWCGQVKQQLKGLICQHTHTHALPLHNIYVMTAAE